MARTGPSRGGRIYVAREMCATCVFRPGNLMRLSPGQLRGMVREAREAESAIICHSTLFEQHADGEAVCRGFYDRYPTQPLQVAERLDRIAWQDVGSTA